MENNSNAIAEIQKKYAGCNLLMPAATEVQLNPFYKITVMEVTADLSENSGDIFKVGSVKTGTTQQGKDIWEETYSPAKPLLMKIAAAAGIQFDPDHTYGTKIDANTYKAKAYGAMRMPDGTGKTHADEKVICLDDEEANYRVEFMDKSIKGITDEKAAKAAAEMFKGNWIDAKNKWGKACKAYVIDDCDREKYIERSVLVNMTLLRKTAAAKAMTGAILRVIRALTGMKGQYTKKELQKPFAIPRVTFSPDYTDPEVRKAMLSQGMNSIGSLFGATPTIAAIPDTLTGGEIDEFNPEEFADNPAFASEQTEDSDVVDEEQEQNWFDREQPTAPQQDVRPQQEEYACENCGSVISEKVYGYSIDKFGRPLCVKCQRGAH
ncbi:hypothetical protein DW848_00400 [Agathobacter rectalis]|uniref:Uncharacterized protein n=1 Tax=Agathobacter rectalis TaxID=39491 RepID=A0A414A7R8_9FIRM|nr:hypothetical protein [Agathobacter rectalis]RHC41831.1 hypothetical protein DW848_00400 [Agathobacter rectalis]